MRPSREPVDDTIDRVAAELTLVVADPTLPKRVAAQLASRSGLSFGWRLPIAVAATAGAAMLAAVAIHDSAGPIDRGRTEDGVARIIPAREIAPAPPVAPAAIVRARVRVASDAHTTQGFTAIEPPTRVRQIDALPSLAMLAVADLNTDLLTIAPVDFAPLDLGDLVVGDVSAPAEPKE